MQLQCLSSEQPWESCYFSYSNSLPLSSSAVVSEHPGAIAISCDIICSKAELMQKSSIRGNTEKEGCLILTEVVSLMCILMLTVSQGEGTCVQVLCPSRRGQELPAVTSASHLLRCSKVGEHVLVVGCALGSLCELTVTLISSVCPISAGIH